MAVTLVVVQVVVVTGASLWWLWWWLHCRCWMLLSSMWPWVRHKLSDSKQKVDGEGLGSDIERLVVKVISVGEGLPWHSM